MHLVLIGRRDPMLPIPTLRARSQLGEIRLQNLCFSDAETATYMQHVFQKSIDVDVAAAWNEKMEGWVTGFRLAALSMKHCADTYQGLLQVQNQMIEALSRTIANGIKPIVTQNAGSIRRSTMTANKDESLKQMKKQYDELNYRWSRERDKFEADLQHTSADARKEYEAKREAYRRLRGELKEKIVDLDVASDNAWEDLKDGAEGTWKALYKAFDKATSHFKK